jgi:hypothetical protein
MGIEIAWSVGVEASGDRLVTVDEVLELADVVAARGASASGIGTSAYGATFLVYAEDRERAVAKAKEFFAQAVAETALPRWEITRIEAESEEDAEPEPGFP